MEDYVHEENGVVVKFPENEEEYLPVKILKIKNNKIVDRYVITIEQLNGELNLKLLKDIILSQVIKFTEKLN